jgi:hypothetical protein
VSPIEKNGTTINFKTRTEYFIAVWKSEKEQLGEGKERKD